jgi:hypothetical protein
MWSLEIDGRLVVWCIDIRWQHERDAHEMDIRGLQDNGALICCAQKQDAAHFGGKWLPLAVTPGYAPPEQPVTKLTDVAFVGYIRDKEREQMLLDINSKFSLSSVQGQFGADAVSNYHQARLGVNVPTRYGHPQAYDSANMRLFEVMATETPVVTPRAEYLADLGLVNEHNCFMYDSPQDLLDVIEKALSGRYDLDGIGEEASYLCNERHTYTHRATQVMEWLDE